MESNISLSCCFVRPNNLRNFTRVRPSFPELRQGVSPDVFLFSSLGNLGGSSPSYSSWYIGTSRARANFSSVSTAGTVYHFPHAKCSNEAVPFFSQYRLERNSFLR